MPEPPAPNIEPNSMPPMRAAEETAHQATAETATGSLRGPRPVALAGALLGLELKDFPPDLERASA